MVDFLSQSSLRNNEVHKIHAYSGAMRGFGPWHNAAMNSDLMPRPQPIEIKTGRSGDQTCDVAAKLNRASSIEDARFTRYSLLVRYNLPILRRIIAEFSRALPAPSSSPD